VLKMATTKDNFNLMVTQFESLFNSPEISETLQNEDKVTYDEIVYDELTQNEGFPSDVDVDKVPHELKFESRISYEDWAENYIDAVDIATSDEFEAKLNDTNEQSLFVMDNLDDTTISIIQHISVDEYLDSNPTLEYLTDRFEKEYDKQAIIEYAEENADDTIDLKIQEQLNDEGFPEDTKPEDVEYVVSEVIQKTPLGEVAEQKLDEVVQGGSVSNYIDTKFDAMLVDEGHVEIEIEVTTEIEDLNE